MFWWTHMSLNQSERRVQRSRSTATPYTKTQPPHPPTFTSLYDKLGPLSPLASCHTVCTEKRSVVWRRDASADTLGPNGLNNFINPLGFALVLAAKNVMFSTCDTGEECGGTLCLEPTRVTVVGSGLLANKETRSGSERLYGCLHRFYGLLIGMNAGRSGRSVMFAVPFKAAYWLRLKKMSNKLNSLIF